MHAYSSFAGTDNAKLMSYTLSTVSVISTLYTGDVDKLSRNGSSPQYMLHITVNHEQFTPRYTRAAVTDQMSGDRSTAQIESPGAYDAHVLAAMFDNDIL
eukprot:1066-Heterococcus_DN1.PRE.2